MDFKDAVSVTAAYYEAFIEGIQCATEEFGCIELKLKIKTTSKELVNWLTKGDLITWEDWFVMNKAKSVKWWVKSISVIEAEAAEFSFFNLWREKYRQCLERQVIKELVA